MHAAECHAAGRDDGSDVSRYSHRLYSFKRPTAKPATAKPATASLRHRLPNLPAANPTMAPRVLLLAVDNSDVRAGNLCRKQAVFDHVASPRQPRPAP